MRRLLDLCFFRWARSAAALQAQVAAAELGGATDFVFGGWQFNGISTGNTGTGSRPERVRDGKLSSSVRTLRRWFDTAAFVTSPLTYDSSGRNVLYTPGRVNSDMGLLMEF